jgi:hypothetical protein
MPLTKKLPKLCMLLSLPNLMKPSHLSKKLLLKLNLTLLKPKLNLLLLKPSLKNNKPSKPLPEPVLLLKLKNAEYGKLIMIILKPPELLNNMLLNKSKLFLLKD